MRESAPSAENTLKTRLARAGMEAWVTLFGWIPTPLGTLLRNLAYRPFMKRLGAARIGTGVDFTAPGNMSLADGVRIGRHCILTAQNGELVMHERAAVSANVHLGADDGRIEIGPRTAIGTGTVLRAANHRVDRVDVPMMDQGHVPGEIVLDEDVWVGANCVIVAGVHVGKGAVVGAGAVVTKDVAPYAIVGGVPARVIGRRKGAPEEDGTGA